MTMKVQDDKYVILSVSEESVVSFCRFTFVILSVSEESVVSFCRFTFVILSVSEESVNFFLFADPDPSLRSG